MEPIRHFADAYMPLFGIHTLETSAFILLVWAADRRLRLDTRLRYGLWLLALVKVFVPPIFLIPAPPPVPVALPEPVLVEPLASASPQVVEESALFSLSLFFLGLWAASVLIMAAITLCQNLALRRRLSHATPLTRPLLPSETENGRIGEPEKNPLPDSALISEPRLQVFSCPAILAPVLIGFRRPRLYLPEGWAAWPEDQLRGILAHELAHLRARDPYVLVLQTLALILFGLNPLVWVMYTRLTHLRELRCDEAAIEQTGIDPVDYSQLLYAFVEIQARRPRLAVTGTYFLENHHAILMRLQHILNFKEGAMKFRKWWHYLAPALLGLAILPLSIQGVEQRSSPPDAAKSEDYIPKPDEFIPVDTQPVSISQPQPKYPEAVRKAGLEGTVYIYILVDKIGKVRDVQVNKGPEVFHEAAKEAAWKSAWKPATRAGKPVAVWVAYPIRFTLKGGPPPPGAWLLGEHGQQKPGHSDTARAERKPQSANIIMTPVKLKAESGDSIVVDKPPVRSKLTGMPKFPYPESARKAGLGGMVLLNILVGKDGRTHKVEVIQGPEIFHQSAIDGAKQFAWEPAIYKGEPVSVWVTHPVRFAPR